MPILLIEFFEANEIASFKWKETGLLIENDRTQSPWLNETIYLLLDYS